MPGSAEFILSGTVSYSKDNPPETGKPYGQIRLRVDVGTECIGQRTVQRHGMFIGVRYGPTDVSNAGFETLRQRLVKGVNILVKGTIKPKPATDKYPASLYVDANWRDIILSNNPFPSRNRVTIDGEFVGQGPGSIDVKCRYRNPMEKDKNKQWQERRYTLSTLQSSTKNAREKVYVEGRLFGVNPDDASKQQVWILIDDLF